VLFVSLWLPGLGAHGVVAVALVALCVLNAARAATKQTRSATEHARQVPDIPFDRVSGARRENGVRGFLTANAAWRSLRSSALLRSTLQSRLAVDGLQAEQGWRAHRTLKLCLVSGELQSIGEYGSMTHQGHSELSRALLVELGAGERTWKILNWRVCNVCSINTEVPSPEAIQTSGQLQRSFSPREEL
jgi:hypothetical protein